MGKFKTEWQTLLAEVVSRVSGKSFAEFTQEYIFDILDTQAMYFTKRIFLRLSKKKKQYSLLILLDAANVRQKVTAEDTARIDVQPLLTSAKDPNWPISFSVMVTVKARRAGSLVNQVGRGNDIQ